MNVLCLQNHAENTWNNMPSPRKYLDESQTKRQRKLSVTVIMNRKILFSGVENCPFLERTSPSLCWREEGQKSF